MKKDSWEIARKDDGAYVLSHNGEQLQESIPERWLEDELSKYGFCGQEYKSIRQALEKNGRALVVLNTPFSDWEN